VRVVDDYAHHPAEIAATLAAARERATGRVIAVFQPHLVSRTRALAPELGAALGAADEAIVTGVYVAREAPDPEVTGEEVARAVPAGTAVSFVPDLAGAGRVAVASARPGDMILTLGAGDVTELGQELLAALGTKYGDGGDPAPADPDP
jgi:UDP-N-acetylmuramate--alanine ligase